MLPLSRPCTPLPALTLILGGARSGKSARAEVLVEAASPHRLYIATSQVWDAEMAERVRQHRQRRDSGWETLEEPLHLASVLDHLNDERPVLIECLTLWLSNVLLGGHDPEVETVRLLGAMAACKAPLVCVASEVGLGIIPENALARRFRDAAGRLNQQVAALADRVEFVAAGLPMVLKSPAQG